MPFGISSAPDEFQQWLNNTMEVIAATPIVDDILVYGVGETAEEAEADHDRKLEELLKCCRDKGVKLNKEKIKLKKTEVTFMGHVISADGLKPEVEAIRSMPRPTNRQDVRRLLGMVKYLQKFSPLRDMLKEEKHFVWIESVHGQCFEEIKQCFLTLQS